jgi:hypothetical protein
MIRCEAFRFFNGFFAIHLSGPGSSGNAIHQCNAKFLLIAHLDTPRETGYTEEKAYREAIMSEKAKISSKNVKKKLPFSKKVFEQKNARRHFLIHKHINTGLTPMEAEELERLEKETTEYVDVIAPFPVETLEQIKAALKEAEKARKETQNV